jgi:outer membrane immunogenic protein
MDFLASGTLRVGYALDHWLLYAKGGAAGASDRYSISGVFSPITTPTPFDFQGTDLRVGWTAGAGVEWAFCEDWSLKVEYDYYNFGHKAALMSESTLGLSGPVDVAQRAQIIKVGLNFHVWSTW